LSSPKREENAIMNRDKAVNKSLVMKKLPTFSALLHIGFFMRLVIEILFWRQNGGETTATTTATTTVTATATTTATKRARR